MNTSIYVSVQSCTCVQYTFIFKCVQHIFIFKLGSYGLTFFVSPPPNNPNRISILNIVYTYTYTHTCLAFAIGHNATHNIFMAEFWLSSISH